MLAVELLELDQWVEKSIKENDASEINAIIEKYTGFIINTISQQKNGYVSIENDGEFSVGLTAFYEAMERYDQEKGHFLPYAKVVINSRLNNYWVKENKHQYVPLEDYENKIINLSDERTNMDLREEIALFEKELMAFGLDFEILADHTPKHRDTRDRATLIGVETSREPDLTKHIFEKKRLPIAKMSKRFLVSVKIIKRSKFYIIAVVIAIIRKFDLILSWIKIDE